MDKPFINAPDAVGLVGRAVFLDARAEPGASEAFTRARVRGAHRADLERHLSEPGDPRAGGRHPLPPLARWLDQLGRWGISPSTPVVVYDASSGGMAGARAWWMLRAAGHGHVFVVEGGWQALLTAGAPTEGGELRAPRTTVGPYPSSVAVWPSVDAELVERTRSDPQWRLLDARAPERYRGDVEPLDPIAGHIPGARNLYWQSQLDARAFPQSTGSIQARFARALDGVTSDHVVCYCGSGVTACHLLLTMEACGLGGAKLYVGSWSEWCRQGRPVARG